MPKPIHHDMDQKRGRHLTNANISRQGRGPLRLQPHWLVPLHSQYAEVNECRPATRLLSSLATAPVQNLARSTRADTAEVKRIKDESSARHLASTTASSGRTTPPFRIIRRTGRARRTTATSAIGRARWGRVGFPSPAFTYVAALRKAERLRNVLLTSGHAPHVRRGPVPR